MEIERKRWAVMPADRWGAAFSLVLFRAGQDVNLNFRSREKYEAFLKDRRFPGLPAEVIFPYNIKATNSPEEALEEADFLVFVPPSHVLRSYFLEIKPFITSRLPMVCLSKGIEEGTMLRMSQVLEGEESGIDARLAVLSGPNLAHEVALDQPTTAHVASKNYDLAKEIQALCSRPNFSIEPIRDVTGVEFGGAFKNVIAVGVGVCEGLRIGDNSRASLIAEGFREMEELIVRLKGKRRTVNRASGLADLIATCSGGRNFKAGKLLAEGRSREEILEELKTVEGFHTAKSMVILGREHEVEVPIAEEVHAVLENKRTIDEAVHNLLTKPLVTKNKRPVLIFS